MISRQLGLARALRLRRSPTPSSRPIVASQPKRPKVIYLICTTPRSGSWLLSEGLASTSLAGNPREWFNHIEEQEQRAQWRLTHASDLTSAAYLDHVLVKSMTPNGISGIKLHYYQFAELPAKLAHTAPSQSLSGAAQLARAFPNVRYVWLTRSDKARQAISLHIANATGRWWQIDGAGQQGRRPAAAEPEYNPEAIWRFERVLQEHDARWRSFFAESGIDPLVVRYEDLVADYRGQVVRVLGWLGVDGSANAQVRPPRLTRQSDARSDDWLRRYQSFRTTQSATSATEPRAAANPVLVTRPDEIGPTWRRWIARERARNLPTDEVSAVLEANGIPHDVVAREMTRASDDPYMQAASRDDGRFRKATSLLNVLGELHKVASGASSVDVRSRLSPGEFRDRYYAGNRPVILRDLMTDWQAPVKWTSDYLKRALGELVVEVMTNRESDPRYEMHADRHRTPMRFGDYVDRVDSGRVTNDYNLVANNGFFQRFATHALLEDIRPLAPYLRPVKGGQQCFLWFGPAGTVTPLHHDTSNILIAHVRGRKRYRLVPATQWRYVYHETGVFGEVDPETPDWSRHPEFRRATVLDVVLHPGEMLFMPVGWWHHVRALDVSITVSFTNFVHPNHFNWEP